MAVHHLHRSGGGQRPAAESVLWSTASGGRRHPQSGRRQHPCRFEVLQMDRSWIKARKFSEEYLNGVKEFINFVRETYAEDAQILCPCRKYLNGKQEPQGKVEDHILIYGMSSTYDRWIHHGEPLNVEADADAQHVDGATDIVVGVAEKDVCLEEEDVYEDDRIHDMIEDLYESEDRGRQESKFAKVIEEQGSAVTDGDSVSAITQQGSRSEYSPEDEAIEEDEVDDIVVEKEDKVSKKARKSINKMTMKCFEKPSKMAPGKTRVIAPASGGSKRVLPGLNSDEHESARVTRQKTKLSLTDHEESLGKMDGGNPTNVDEGSLHVCADVRSSMHGDERSLMHGGEVSLMQMDERSRAPSTVCTNQPMEVPEFSQQQPDQQQPDQQQQMDIEATPIVDKCRKGKGLEKLTKELGSKIIIQVAEGKKCPDKPAQAAKLTSQGGVAARHHLPILPHFKEYKANGHHIDTLGKLLSDQF